MNAYLGSISTILTILLGIGSIVGTFFLTRFTYKVFQTKRMVKGVILSFASLMAILISLIFIVTIIGVLVSSF